jgi:DNA-binding NtrC family response regulator
MAMMNTVEASRSSASNPATEVQFTQGMTLADIERSVILETLRRQNLNRTRAARVLGIGIRTLQRKLKQYRAEVPGLMVLDA